MRNISKYLAVFVVFFPHFSNASTELQTLTRRSTLSNNQECSQGSCRVTRWIKKLFRNKRDQNPPNVLLINTIDSVDSSKMLHEKTIEEDSVHRTSIPESSTIETPDSGAVQHKDSSRKKLKKYLFKLIPFSSCLFGQEEDRKTPLSQDQTQSSIQGDRLSAHRERSILRSSSANIAWNQHKERCIRAQGDVESHLRNLDTKISEIKEEEEEGFSPEERNCIKQILHEIKLAAEAYQHELNLMENELARFENGISPRRGLILENFENRLSSFLRALESLLTKVDEMSFESLKTEIWLLQGIFPRINPGVDLY